MVMRIGEPGLVPKKEPPKKRNIVSIGEVQPMPHHTKLLDFCTTEMLVLPPPWTKSSLLPGTL